MNENEKKKVTPDVYLLRFIYDHHKYDFVTHHDLQKEIDWEHTKLQHACISLSDWGFTGDQTAGEIKSKPGYAGTGICLDEKYAIAWFFENKCLKLEEMINPYCKEKTK